jgi:hypothetical protein
MQVPMPMKSNSHVYEALKTLQRNAHRCKYMHFFAGDRNYRNHLIIGLPNIVFNILIGSVLFVSLKSQLPSAMTWIGAFLSLLAAMLGSLNTFFDFQSEVKAHRRLGDEYLEISRKCQLVIAEYDDGLIDLQGLDISVNELQAAYFAINKSAQEFTTSDNDYYRALREEKRNQRLKSDETAETADKNNSA